MLTMVHQFKLAASRPNVTPPGVAVTPTPSELSFKVKGITPFYDYEKEYYKYLIYGEYVTDTNTTTGCIKYYDPGEKIGPGHNLNASELYDIVTVYSNNVGGRIVS